MTEWIEAGETAPPFTLTSDSGESVSLQDLRGRPVVIYFYPKDFTPGCTVEACAFRDLSQQRRELGVTVLGISPDSAASHADFRRELGLDFTLLADPEHTVAERFGAWREKNMYGKKSMGIQRSSFLIDAAGQVAKVWKRVRVDGHAEAVLAAARDLAAATA